MFSPVCFALPKNRKGAIAWVRTATKEVGLGFHPDTRASEYIDLQTEKPTFSKQETEAFEKARNRAFDLLGDSIYEYGLTVQRRLLRSLTNG